MNVLIINYEFPPVGGGAANASFFIAKELQKLGHKVVILTSKYKDLKGYSHQDDLHIYRINALRKSLHKSNIFEMMSFVISAFSCIGGIIRKNKIDKAIVFFTIPSGLIGPYILRRFNVKYIISLRGGDVPGLEPSLKKTHDRIRKMRQAILRKALSIVANSKGLAEASIKYDPFEVKIIPNGVDTSFYSPSKRVIKNNEFNFLFVGRFQEQKNLFFLLEQFAIFAKDKEKVILTLIGDGPLKNELMSFAESLNILDKLRWKNWQGKNELAKDYQEADCLINPSIYEGMPNVVLEAMASGLPIIASRIMGNDELVIHELNGFLFGLDEHEKFQNQMTILYLDEKLRMEMGTNSRKIVEANYSWNKVAKAYEELLIIE